MNIATMENNLGATWNRDNVIVVAPVNRTVLHQVSAAGGTPEPITALNADRRQNSHRWPHFLPDGRHFLFTARSDVKENNRPLGEPDGDHRVGGLGSLAQVIMREA